MRRTTVVVVGGGQAGLAMSRCLTDLAVDHVVLERGAVAQSWRSERWDSLRLLTPNWSSRLPGFAYQGPDPDGFMTASEVVGYLDRYQRSFGAPVETETAVCRMTGSSSGFSLTTDQGQWHSRAVVIATGAFSHPAIPAWAGELPASIVRLAPVGYRNPSQLGGRRVLVVGASASGAQIAEELVVSGHQVTLAVGEHVRVPRTYRGRDIHWWLEVMGRLDERYDQVEDLNTARRRSSLQLVGSAPPRDLDLNSLAALGVGLVGRVMGADERRVVLSGSLANVAKLADLKLNRLLDEIDTFAAGAGLAGLGPVWRPAPTDVPPNPPNTLDLAEIDSVVWATGCRPRYPWLPGGLLDAKGGLRHDGGVIVDQPGLYVLGLPFLRRRKSSFLDGVAGDAVILSGHLRGFLDQGCRRVSDYGRRIRLSADSR